MVAHRPDLPAAAALAVPAQSAISLRPVVPAANGIWIWKGSGRDTAAMTAIGTDPFSTFFCPRFPLILCGFLLEEMEIGRAAQPTRKTTRRVRSLRKYSIYPEIHHVPTMYPSLTPNVPLIDPQCTSNVPLADPTYISNPPLLVISRPLLY